jgi:molybdate transport repressor ModE-like protein
MWDEILSFGGAMGTRTRKKHPEKALTAVAIRALKKPGRYADGNGLYLKVTESGAKRWELRTVVRGKRCDIGLGGLKLVSLAEAREQAEKYRKIARNEGDPIAEKRRTRPAVLPFKEADAVDKEHTKTWKKSEGIMKEDDDQVVGARLRVIVAPGVRIGWGKVALLQGIRETGSIAAAGRRINMSYKRAWYLVDAMNGHFKLPLVAVSRGGSRGGGAALTRLGEEMLASFREMEALTDAAVAPVLRRLERRTGSL